METLLSRLITATKRGVAKIEELAFLTNGNQASRDTSQHSASRNGAVYNGQTNGTSATRSTSTIPASLSHAERDEFWKTRQDIPPHEQLRVWEQCMEDFLEPIRNDPANRDHFDFLRRLLRQNAHQAVETVQVSAKQLYSTFMLGEGAEDIQYFLKRIESTSTLEEIARSKALIERLARMYGEHTATGALSRISALIDAKEEDGPSIVIGTCLHTQREIGIPFKALSQMVAAFGSTGVGKSVFLHGMINSAIAQNMSVIVIDPHAELLRNVVASLPESDLDRVTYLDFTSDDAVGMNLFDTPEPRTMQTLAQTASLVSHIWEVLFHSGFDTTPRLMQNLRAVTRLLIESPGNNTLVEIPLIFSSDAARANMVANLTLTNSSIISYWEGYNRLTQRDKDAQIASLMNKIQAFVDEPMIRMIVGQSRTTIDFREFMDSDPGKILLVALNPVFGDASKLLAGCILAKILQAAMSRIGQEPKPCLLVADEWHTYLSADVARLLAEARKFNVAVCLATQTLDSIDLPSRAAALQAGTLVTFRVSGNDAKMLARSYSLTQTQNELIGQEPVRAVVTDPIAHLLHHAHHDARVAKFAQTYLQNLEQFIKKPNGTYEHQHQWAAYYDCFNWTIYLTQRQVLQGRELITQSLYQSMVNRRPASQIAPLAVYTLAIAQGDGREFIFSPWVKKSVDTFTEFSQGAERFGTPAFTTPESAAQFIQAAHKQYKWMAEAIIRMLTEWRYVLSALAEHPLLCDTGNFVPKYRQRPFSDLEAERAVRMATQDNYQAYVKILTEEHVIKTNPPLPLLPKEQVNERIRHIQARMRSQGITRSHSEVEEEIRLRQERLRERPATDAPPPSSTNGNSRRYRHRPAART